MTHQLYRLPRVLILAAAGVWIGLALKVAPAWAADTPLPKITLKGRITAAKLKDELLKACREQTPPETLRKPALAAPAPVPAPPPVPPTAPEFRQAMRIEQVAGSNAYRLCQALGTGSEAPCSSAKKEKNGCVESYQTHQLLMLVAQNNSAAAMNACMRFGNALGIGQSEYCQIVVEAFQGDDVDGGCGKLLAIVKPAGNKNKWQRNCVRGWQFLEGERMCDARTPECVSCARLRLAAKAKDAKECGDSVTCLAAMTHSTDPCVLPSTPPAVPGTAPVPPLPDLAASLPDSAASSPEDSCERKAALQEGVELSEEESFRKKIGWYGYKAGEPLLHLLPPSEVPPPPAQPPAPAPTQPPLDPPKQATPPPLTPEKRP